MTEGLLARANRSAEGCYRRRWKGEEIGMREEKVKEEEEEEDETGRERRWGAVSCTEDVGWPWRDERRRGNDMPG